MHDFDPFSGAEIMHTLGYFTKKPAQLHIGCRFSFPGFQTPLIHSIFQKPQKLCKKRAATAALLSQYIAVLISLAPVYQGLRGFSAADTGFGDPVLLKGHAP